MRITEQNNFAENDRLKKNNFAEDLRDNVQNVIDESAEISPETETVFLPRLTNISENKPLKLKSKVCKDACIETVRSRVEDKGVNTDVIHDEVKEKVQENGKKKGKEKGKEKVKEKVKVEETSLTKDKGVNTKIMGKIVAGNIRPQNFISVLNFLLILYFTKFSM